MYDLFRRAELVEMLSAAIYGALAKQFRGDEPAQALFLRLEEEEHQHVSRIRLLAGTYRNDPKLLERLNGAEALDGCVVAAEAALGEVSAGAWGTDLREVKRRLALLEAELSKAHVQLIAQNANPALLEFFRQLALQDEAHAGLLKP